MEKEKKKKKCVRFKREKVVSKETYLFFRVTFTKIHYIKINNLRTQMSYNTLYEAHLKDKSCKGDMKMKTGEEKKCVR